MKLSFRFFYIAYVVVLISVGLSGIFLIKSTNDTLWNMQIEQANIDAKYAADSFLALADISYTEMSEHWIDNTIDQIKNNLSNTVMDVELYTADTVKDEFLNLKDSEGISQFIKENNLIIFETFCRLNVGENAYYLALYSDFTSLYKQCNSFWNNYRIVAISVSIISGFLLFALTKRIVRPLDVLTKHLRGITSAASLQNKSSSELDEFQLILSTVTSLQDNNEQIRSIQQRTKYSITQSCLGELVMGHYTDSPEQMEKKINYLGLIICMKSTPNIG